MCAVTANPTSTAEDMLTVGADRADSERKFLDDVVNEVDGVRLRVVLVDLERSHSCRDVDRGVLITSNRASLPSLQREELHVDLHVMPVRFQVDLSVPAENGGASKVQR